MQVRPIAERGDGMVATGRLAESLSAATGREACLAKGPIQASASCVKGRRAQIAQGGHLRGGGEVPADA